MVQPGWEELCVLEPRLEALEAKARATHDDGKGSFYCSNFVWLPLNSDLKDLIGVARRGPDPDPVVRSSVSYETAYVHLSRLLPPCRDCGCCKFEPWRTET